MKKLLIALVAVLAAGSLLVGSMANAQVVNDCKGGQAVFEYRGQEYEVLQEALDACNADLGNKAMTCVTRFTHEDMGEEAGFCHYIVHPANLQK